MAKALRNKLNEEFLTCQICLNIYREPVILECQHSFCRECASQCSTVASRGIHCPICRQCTVFPKKQGITTLKKNFFLQSLIDTLGTRRESNASTISLICPERNGGCSKLTKRRNPRCDTCDDQVKAMMRCLDCCDFLCTDCHLVHCHTKFTKKHKVVNLGSLKSGKYSSEIQARGKIFCTKHEDEICRMFCKSCKSPVCHDCIQEHCSVHSMINIKDAVENAKKYTSEVIDMVETSMKCIELSKNHISDSKATRRSEKESVLKSIDVQTKTIVAAAKQHGRALTEAVKSVVGDHMKVLNKHDKQISKKLSTIEQAYSNLKQEQEAVFSSGGPEEVLAMLNTVEETEKILNKFKETGDMDSSWLKEANAITLVCGATTDLNPSEIVARYIGRLLCKEFIHGDSRHMQEFNTRDLIICNQDSEEEQVAIGTIYTDDVDEYYKIRTGSIENSLTEGATTIVENGAAYGKIIPKKRRNAMKKTPIVESVYASPTESPSMTFRRKKYTRPTRELPPLISPQSPVTTSACNGNLGSDKEEVYFTDSQDDNSIGSHEPSSGNQAETLEPRVFPLLPSQPKQTTSVHRTRSLASLSAQIMGRKRNDPTCEASLPSAPSLDRLNQDSIETNNSQPNFLRDSLSVWNPVKLRSAENLADATRSGQVATGETLINNFLMHGQSCTFMSAPKLTVLPNGNIVASDYKAQRIFRFTCNGNFMNSFKTTTNGNSLHPIAVSATKKGKIAVTCGQTLRIFGQNGKPAKKFGNGFFSKCCGLALDKKTNKLVISDIEKGCISIHFSDGGLDRIFRGGTGAHFRQTENGAIPEPPVLHTPYFVAVDQRNGNILVSDWANHDVKIFDKDGNCLACISSCAVGEMGRIRSQQNFLNPAGVCCDDDGNIFIADQGHNRIAMFNNNWQFQRFIATEYDGLHCPWSLVIDCQGRLLVSEYWTKTIKSFKYSVK